jgi:UDP-galactopyranose mutase
MDELSGFQDAAPELEPLESELLSHADIVFTGGASLYEAKRGRHRNVHLFPSAVDAAHFKSAREPLPDPADQAGIPHPRIGFFGAIDERLDSDLLAAVARLRPDWQLILVGPVIKIDPANLPQAPNLHYLGGRKYEKLPAYIANWDAAMMPFASNQATRFISPTKTPEYLAAGKPVISTPITDVVRRWGHLAAVRIAATPSAFADEMAAALLLRPRDPHWLRPIDRELKEISWDRTWAEMARLIDAAYAERHAAATIGSGLADRAIQILPCST